MTSCNICGADNPADNKFCKDCGNSLQGEGTGKLNPDTMLEGRYIIVKTIGRGGMGAIYLALDTRLNHMPVAIKEMSTQALQGDLQAAIAAFQKEASLLISLRHPALPVIRDFFSRSESRWYLVMDYIEGRNLKEIVDQRGPIPEAEVLDWAEQLCDILDYLHSQNPPIIFRDMKPSNIMLTPQGQIKLIDFGIARHFRQGSTADTSAYGSHGFAAPEQYGQNQTDPRADLYALGATLHYLLTGIDPTPNPFNFNPPSQHSQVSPRTETTIMKALEFKAENRPRDAREVLNLLPGNKGRRLPERAKYLETAPTMPAGSGNGSPTAATTVPVSSHEAITQPTPNNLPDLGGNQAETVPVAHMSASPEKQREIVKAGPGGKLPKASVQNQKRKRKIGMIIAAVLVLLIIGYGALAWYLDQQARMARGDGEATQSIDWQDLERVEVNGEWGFTDKNGNIVIDIQYDYVEDFAEGLAAFTENGKEYGYINAQGEVIVEPQYNWADNFSEGLAVIRVDNTTISKYGYLDTNGEMTIAAKYDYGLPFADGQAQVREGGKWFYINSKDQVISDNIVDDSEVVDFQITGKGSEDNGEYEYTYIVSFKNTGNTTWVSSKDQGYGYTIKYMDGDRSAVDGEIYMADKVLPGGTFTCESFFWSKPGRKCYISMEKSYEEFGTPVEFVAE